MSLLRSVLLYMIPAIIAAVFAIYAWRRRSYRSGRPFVLFMSAIAFWCACHAMSIAAPTFEGTLFWSLVQYAGIITIMPAWLILAISYSGEWWRRRQVLQIGLFVPALLFYILVLTNDLHQLWWTSVQPDESRGFMWLKVTRGPFFWMHSIYAYTCFIASIVLFTRVALKAAPINRRHAWLMLVAALIPAFSNILYIAGIITLWGDDPTPIFLFAGGALAFYATVHFRVIDLAPLAERAVVAALPDGIMIIDNQQRVVEANPAATQLLGLNSQSVVGQQFEAFIGHSSYAPELKQLLANTRTTQTLQMTRGEQDQLQGLEIRLRPLRAANDEIAGQLLLLRDISEGLRAEQAQIRHLAELSLINQIAQEANSATETNSLIKAITQAIAETGQWDRIAVCLADQRNTRLNIIADHGIEGGHNYEGAFMRGDIIDVLISVLQEKQSRVFDLKNPLALSPTVTSAMQFEALQHILVIPLYHRQEGLGLLVLGSVASRPYNPAQLRIAETIGELITDAIVRTQLYEEVLTADKLKSSFLATVSHELRTPLTSIMGYIEMLQRGIYGQPNKEMREPFQHMYSASFALLRLITDIMEFTQMEAGVIKTELGIVDPRRVIYDVTGRLRPQIHAQGLDLQIDLADKLPMIYANSTRIEQVLSNLLTNSIKFTHQGGITIRASQHRRMVRISVSDTGIGIAPENRQIIFQEFRRVSTTERHYGGAGLGLAISQRLLALMGGNISVESTLGAGSTFTIEIPAAEETSLINDEAQEETNVVRA